MPTRFNPAPGWPVPPPGWQPPPGWKPDPSWPDPPPGWPLWIEAPAEVKSAKRTWGLVGAAATSLGLVIALGAWLYPDYNDPNRVSSGEQRSPYAAIVNELCLETFDELATLGPPQDDPAAMQAYAGGMSDTYAGLIQRWSAIELPVPGDEPAVRSMLDALERLSIAFADMGAAFSVSNPDLIRDRLSLATEALDEAGADFRSAAGLYGVDECVSLGR
jgi:hypothetical protein